MKKVVIINHSDTRGGASVVSYRLMQALAAQGVDARMLVMHKGTDSLRVEEVGTPRSRRAAFLAECAQIYTHNGFNRRDLFKVSTGSYGISVHNHPWVLEADAIVLGWVNQGMLSLDETGRLAALGKPMAWTLHDMWPVTGVCHHAGNCERYTGHCGNCPLLCGGRRAHDLSYKVFGRKLKLYGQHPIHLVPVSNWMAGKCRASALGRDLPLTVIPNAFPVDEYSTVPATSRRQLHLPDGLPLVVMGAARLDDPIKNLPLAVETLNGVHEAGVNCAAVFYGDLRDPAALDALRLPHVWLGKTDMHSVAQIYAHATAVLSTSHYETLPGTLIEGMAAGCTPVATANGGQPDIVDNGTDGWLCDADAVQLAEALTKAVTRPFDRDAQHRAVARRFAAERVARQYMRLLDLMP